MPQVIILGTALSIQAKRPTTRYGVINPMPIDQAMAVMLLRTSLSRIPRKATITSARVRVAQHRETSGGRTLRIRAITSSWSSKTTWRTRPDTSSILTTVEKGASPISTRWVFDVTSTVQKIINGTWENRGWEISMEETVALKFRGTPADSRPPDIVVEYAVTPDEPTNLHPSSGEISVSNPTLTFDADDEITALDVQIDPQANETAPAWDSGTIAATGGLLDLADPDGLLPTPYPGLADGSTTYWRVRQRNAAGWSDWSEWAQMTRTGVGTLVITQPPSGTISDPTPTIGWTFSGVQTAWRVRMLNEDGDQLANSGTTVGTDDLWRPRKGFTHAGQSGYIVVDVWDDTDRVATPDQTEYVTATLPVTFTPDATVDPVAQLEAVQLDATPDVTLRGTRAVIPDTLSVYRSIRGGEFLLLDTYDALDVFESGEGSVLVATNYETNPSFETGIGNWIAVSGSTTPETTTERAWVGAQSVYCTRGPGTAAAYANHRIDNLLPAGEAGTYTLICRAWAPAANAGLGNELRVGGAGVSPVVSVAVNAVDDWVPIAITFDWNGTDGAYLFPRSLTVDPAAEMWIDAIRIDSGVIEPDAYFDGDTADTAEFTYSWTGEPNNSASEKRTAPMFNLVDHSAPMNSRNIRYYVTAGVENKNSEQGPIARLDTRGLGVWITDLETGDRAVIWGVEAEQESTENAIVHEPLNRTNHNYNQKVIRRRLVTYQPQGTVDGILATVSQPGMPTAEQCERQFRRWRNNDAGHLYQIHLGRDTRPVILGDIALAEREENRATDRLLNVSFGWWSQYEPDEG